MGQHLQVPVGQETPGWVTKHTAQWICTVPNIGFSPAGLVWNKPNQQRTYRFHSHSGCFWQHTQSQIPSAHSWQDCFCCHNLCAIRTWDYTALGDRSGAACAEHCVLLFSCLLACKQAPAAHCLATCSGRGGCVGGWLVYGIQCHFRMGPSQAVHDPNFSALSQAPRCC